MFICGSTNAFRRTFTRPTARAGRDLASSWPAHRRRTPLSPDSTATVGRATGRCCRCDRSLRHGNRVLRRQPVSFGSARCRGNWPRDCVLCKSRCGFRLRGDHRCQRRPVLAVIRICRALRRSFFELGVETCLGRVFKRRSARMSIRQSWSFTPRWRPVLG